jgi:beta-mannosidase
LHDGWVLTPAPETALPAGVGRAPVPATVPGCVHTDLLAAGVIPDPYLDDNEERQHWIGHADWVYETTFGWSAGTAADTPDEVDLVCAGLDTVATITLNGVEVARTANMHRGYRFPVRHLLVDGINRLQVRFDSAYGYAEALRAELGDRPMAYAEPFNFIRKMACNFGWDWGPTLVTAGIWRQIGLESWSTARLAQVRPQVTVDGQTGVAEVYVEIERAPGSQDEPLVLIAEVAGSTVEVAVGPGQRSAVARLRVDSPELWWPRGYGEQRRYPLNVSLRSIAGSTLDGWRRRVGFRALRVETVPDEHGSPFTVVVNDVPVFVRGVNWIPDDTFPHRISRERYAARLTQACEANINFLRIWGGGIYEADDFYDLADEYGLLVGQDFLFACAAYPEEAPLYEEVAAEARYNVVRLASHPSLALWTGNNENIWGYADWDWKPRLQGRSWGAGYYFDLLPRIVAELDPVRPYWPGSPYSGDRDLHPNDPAHGTMHIWDVWNSRDYLHYRSYQPRFVAEFGYQGPPAYATLRRALSDDPLASDSPGMRHHQKATDGDAKLRRGLDAHLPVPRDFDDWHYFTQLNQARAVTVGVEHFRSLRPLCMGSIVWQLNDCWPVTSWAAVDGDGRRKPLWFALRRIFADRLLTIQPRDNGLAVVAVNEARQPWLAEVSVTRLSLDGQPRAKSTLHIEVPAGAASTVPLGADLANPEDPRAELLLADVGGERTWWFFSSDRELAYPRAEYEARVEPAPEGLRVIVTAGTILRDLILYPDRLDPTATVDEAMVTLLPGESATFTVSTTAALDPALLTVPPVLRCVNDIR